MGHRSQEEKKIILSVDDAVRPLVQPPTSVWEPLVENVVLCASALVSCCTHIALVVQFELWRTSFVLNVIVCVGVCTTVLNHGIRSSVWKHVDRCAMVVLGLLELYPLLTMPGAPYGKPAGLAMFLYCGSLLAMAASLYFISRIVLERLNRLTSMINTLCHTSAHILLTFTHALMITQLYLYDERQVMVVIVAPAS